MDWNCRKPFYRRDSMPPIKPVHRALILEEDEKLRDQVCDILTRTGWDVTRESEPKTALSKMETAKSVSPFILFITGFKPADMEVDEVLTAVRKISPHTQRILLVKTPRIETLMAAINKAGINACITAPFGEEDFMAQVGVCMKSFMALAKREQLKRFTIYQNKKMFQLAQNLKKRKKALSQLIQQKKNQKKILLSQQKRSASTQKNDPLYHRMGLHEISSPTQSTFTKEFSNLREHINFLFDQFTSAHQLEAVEAIPLSPRPPCALPTDIDSRIQDFLNGAYASDFKRGIQVPVPVKEADPFEKFVYLNVSDDGLTARLCKQKNADAAEIKSLEELKAYLERKQITDLCLGDEQLKKWIQTASDKDPPIVVAKGISPVKGKDGSVTYEFQTDFSNPGKILEDGSIDFRERGPTPFVHKGDLLAVKEQPRPGTDGINVFKDPITVEPVADPQFIPGPGTLASEDGLSIYADTDGQPNLDPMGTITVNPELRIKGDVGYETGNIDFNGNIFVTGMIKEGFIVKGVNLTARETHGAIIDIQGDLCVSNGIMNTKVSTRGDIFCKYINNSKIEGFGDVFVHKEIIDSFIRISGAVKNTTGHIISSKIAAKGGVEGYQIGTQTSEPSMIKVGSNDHTQHLIDKIDDDLKDSVNALKQTKEAISEIEQKDQNLYGEVTEAAQVQEGALRDIANLKEKIQAMEKTDPLRQKNIQAAKKLAAKAKTSEARMNEIFELQEHHGQMIDALLLEVKKMEEQNLSLVQKKKGIREFNQKQSPLARVDASRALFPGTTIQGPNAVLITDKPHSRCRLQEVSLEEDNIRTFKILLSSL